MKDTTRFLIIIQVKAEGLELITFNAKKKTCPGAGLSPIENIFITRLQQQPGHPYCN
jgi:hypothetical protein